MSLCDTPQQSLLKKNKKTSYILWMNSFCNAWCFVLLKREIVLRMVLYDCAIPAEKNSLSWFAHLSWSPCLVRLICWIVFLATDQLRQANHSRLIYYFYFIQQRQLYECAIHHWKKNQLSLLVLAIDCKKRLMMHLHSLHYILTHYVGVK